MLEAAPDARRRGRRARAGAEAMGGHWLAELDGRRVTVEVPASSANLGAGYDCLGVALDLTNRVELEVRGWSRGEIELTVEGEGSDELTDDRENRFVRGLEAALVAGPRRASRRAWAGGSRCATRSRSRAGSGSSAAATVAGVVAANALHGRAAGPRRPAAHRDRRSRAIRTTPPPRCSAGSSSRPRHRTAWRRSASMSPRDLRAVLFIPELRLSTDGDAPGPAQERAAGGRRREPRRGRRRRGRPGRRPDGPAARA